MQRKKVAVTYINTPWLMIYLPVVQLLQMRPHRTNTTLQASNQHQRLHAHQWRAPTINPDCNNYMLAKPQPTEPCWWPCLHTESLAYSMRWQGGMSLRHVLRSL